CDRARRHVAGRAAARRARAAQRRAVAAVQAGRPRGADAARDRRDVLSAARAACAGRLGAAARGGVAARHADRCGDARGFAGTGLWHTCRATGAGRNALKSHVMDRRRFIRVAGGGVVLAAGAGMAGCSAALPPEAIAVWQGPPADLELRRWVLSHAILAPHSHNLQSWLVDLKTPGEIVLRCDPTRLLPETDPFSRQIMMSHGTFLELLDLAARERGQRTEITLFPEGEFGADKLDSRAVARIRLQPDATLRPDPLFAQIVRRHTNRSVYDVARPVPAEAWAAMAEAARADGLRFGFAGADNAAALAQHRAIAAEAWRIELVTPRAMLESLHVMRIGAAEVAQHRDGLTMLDPTVVWLTRLGLFDRSKA